MPVSSITLAGGLNPGLNSAHVRGWALDAGFAEAGLVALPHGADARMQNDLRSGRPPDARAP